MSDEEIKEGRKGQGYVLNLEGWLDQLTMEQTLEGGRGSEARGY